jgi:Asp/Glu/hydantoin racemase
MRILLLNPNTSTSVTQRLEAVAARAAARGTSITALTAPRGVPYISGRAEAQIAGALVLEMLAEHLPRHDAAIIAAFGDPGLPAARELFDQPIVGMAEAAMLTAAMLGPRFSIVTFAPALASWYRDCVEASGMGHRLAAIRSGDGRFSAIDTVASEKEDALAALCRRTVEEDGADVVILGGAPLAGLAARIGGNVPVPLVEQAAAALLQAETLVRLGTAPARSGAFARPLPKPATGLAPKLAARIAGTDA